jgi:hypothetical protein
LVRGRSPPFWLPNFGPQKKTFFSPISQIQRDFFGDNFIDYRAKMALHMGDLCFASGILGENDAR